VPRAIDTYTGNRDINLGLLHIWTKRENGQVHTSTIYLHGYFQYSIIHFIEFSPPHNSYRGVPTFVAMALHRVCGLELVTVWENRYNILLAIFHNNIIC